jgi:hypothetical protein
MSCFKASNLEVGGKVGFEGVLPVETASGARADVGDAMGEVGSW